MARYVFITGGVVSSLGKGLASAALGALLQARGYSVRLRKLDPYLNVDPGTMSPFEHGEVFVTDDGAETDLDLGHYERFTGVAARRTDSISAGRVYSNVLEKERRGDYLGKTIQVIPHVTNEIKEFLRIGDAETDFMLCEIGGTVGDIEGLPSSRPSASSPRRGRAASASSCTSRCCPTSPPRRAEDQAHPALGQELRSIGLAPGRARLPLRRPDPPEGARQARALLQRPHRLRDRRPGPQSIYEAPLAYHREGLDQAVLDAFGISPRPRPNLAKWEDVVDRVHNPEGEVRVAIVGSTPSSRTPTNPSPRR
jgi:CTP synthase